MIRGFPSHIDLTVSDLGESTRFYDIVLTELGFKRLLAENAPCWAISGDNAPVFSIALQQARTQDRHNRYSAGLHHLAFHAESHDEVDTFYDFLLRHSITVLDAPAEYDYTPGYYAVFFADPDGIKLELVYEPNVRS